MEGGAEMTVGELREQLAGLPDNMEVVIAEDGPLNDVCYTYVAQGIVVGTRLCGRVRRHVTHGPSEPAFVLATSLPGGDE